MCPHCGFGVEEPKEEKPLKGFCDALGGAYVDHVLTTMNGGKQLTNKTTN